MLVVHGLALIRTSIFFFTWFFFYFRIPFYQRWSCEVGNGGSRYSKKKKSNCWSHYTSKEQVTEAPLSKEHKCISGFLNRCRNRSSIKKFVPKVFSDKSTFPLLKHTLDNVSVSKLPNLLLWEHQYSPDFYSYNHMLFNLILRPLCHGYLHYELSDDFFLQLTDAEKIKVS